MTRRGIPTIARRSSSKSDGGRLACLPAVERSYTPDRQAMVAALRLVLGLPVSPTLWLEEADGAEDQTGRDL
jgi:hypothetical protein